MQGRRGTLYHIPEALKLKKRYSSGRYFYSAPSIIKILVVIELVVSAILFLTTDVCPGTEDWYQWLYPTATLTSAILSLAIEALFILGLAEDNPRIWVYVELILTTAEAVFVLVAGVLTLTSCSSHETEQVVLGPLDLIGAALLVVNDAASYIMWRTQKDDDKETPTTPNPQDQIVDDDAPPPPRKSVFI